MNSWDKLSPCLLLIVYWLLHESWLNNNARIICLHCLFWDCLQFPFRIRASFMKRKIAASFLSESQFHHSPCFPKLMKTISKKSHSPLGSDWWITFEMNKWTIFKKAIRLWWWNEGIIAVMNWRGQDHLVNKAGHCNHVEDGHHFGVLQQKCFDGDFWARTLDDADRQKGKD